MNSIEKIVEIIKEAKKIAIFTHMSPDGDAVGSSLALKLALASLGKVAKVYIDDDIPEMYKFLKDSETISLPLPFAEADFDCIIYLDCADETRAGEQAQLYLNRALKTINIDHHLSNTFFADFNYVDADASATGEIVYNVISQLTTDNIQPDIATSLYTAIATDTGSFKYDNTSSTTLKIASRLIEMGVDLSKVRVNVWENKKLASIKSLSEILATLNLTHYGKIAWIKASREVIKKYDIKAGELEEMINYPKSISGVEIAIFFKEPEEGEVRVSFRSKTFIDVSELAAKFEGGGHARAAGCTIKGSLEDVIERVLEYTKRFYSEQVEKSGAKMK